MIQKPPSYWRELETATNLMIAEIIGLVIGKNPISQIRDVANLVLILQNGSVRLTADEDYGSIGSRAVSPGFLEIVSPNGTSMPFSALMDEVPQSPIDSQKRYFGRIIAYLAQEGLLIDVEDQLNEYIKAHYASIKDPHFVNGIRLYWYQIAFDPKCGIKITYLIGRPFEEIELTYHSEIFNDSGKFTPSHYEIRGSSNIIRELDLNVSGENVPMSLIDAITKF